MHQLLSTSSHPRKLATHRLGVRLVAYVVLATFSASTTASEEPSPSENARNVYATSVESGSDQVPERPDFELHVMAVLSRAGCNQGVCHGNQNGKGGFFLSLRGQDPDADYFALTEALAGRRLNRNEPEKSLFLAKATAATAHRGGQRFDSDSFEYELLVRWLEQGAERQTESLHRKSVAIDASPSAIVIEPGQSEQIQLSVSFDDGSVQPINPLAVFESTELVVDVDALGQVAGDRIGESTIIARYLGHQIAIPVAVVPGAEDSSNTEPDSIDSTANQESALHSTIELDSPIDVLIREKLERLRIDPSPACDDVAFLRRVYIDALGRIPTVEEAKRFLVNTQGQKRDRLIDEVISRPEFASYWALKWSDVLRNEEKVLDKDGVMHFHNWIRDGFIEGRPLDQFARELISSRGSTYEQPPANFYRALRDPLARGEATARLFLGVRLQCAKCHNHPFEQWSQDDYYSWAAVFARIDYEIVENRRRDKYDKNEFVGEQIVNIIDEGEVQNPRTKENATPRFLGDASAIDESDVDRLVQLADWITYDERFRFARVQANFIWYHLMGEGLVAPIDDFRVTNPASNERLLDWLANELIDSEFDTQSLVRTIMQSKAYQRSSEPLLGNRHDTRNFAYTVVRRVAAEPLLDMQNQVLATRSVFADYPNVTRATELPGALVRRPEEGDRFLKQFGKPTRLLGCECERMTTTTLSQAFELISGGGLQNRLEESDNIIYQRLAEERDSEAIITELFWRSLSRAPTQLELETAMTLVDTSPAQDQGLQDIAWSLLNSKEFIFRR